MFTKGLFLGVWWEIIALSVLVFVISAFESSMKESGASIVFISHDKIL